ncbi:hypothetical protein EDB83DRAFT_676780 [Lactarius deliciosus]|nr:hypothetical protein EDB83DRAFT_676780 [Lactarius deliciosus]
MVSLNAANVVTLIPQNGVSMTPSGSRSMRTRVQPHKFLALHFLFLELGVGNCVIAGAFASQPSGRSWFRSPTSTNGHLRCLVRQERAYSTVWAIPPFPSLSPLWALGGTLASVPRGRSSRKVLYCMGRLVTYSSSSFIKFLRAAWLTFTFQFPDLGHHDKLSHNVWS